MNMVIPDEGKTKILDELFRTTSAREDFVLDLFQNNVVVNDLSTFTDFTVSTFQGYAQVSVTRGSFNAAIIVGGVGAITKAAAPTFTCSGGSAQNAYGWILRGASSGIIYAGQNFDVVRSMSTGATESIDPFTIKDKTFT